ncbi:MAG: OmpA family protein [Saprospiraceae bacterium]
MKHLLTFLLFSILSVCLSAQITASKASVNGSNNGLVGKDKKVTITNLEKLNSAELDYCPVVYKGGIVFTSTRKNKSSSRKKYSDIFYSERDQNGEFKTPQPMEGKINSRYHDGSATFSVDGNLMIFSRNNKKGKSKDGLVGLKIYASSLQNGSWSEVKELGFNDDRYSNCHPSLSYDGNKLYFASNRPGGFGGMDIYVVEKKNGKWENPVNLGPEVNSNGNEIFPFINFDGKLYFASNGRDGWGGLDIYMTIPSSEDKSYEYRQAVNLGQPFNSASDDFGFIIEQDGMNGLFASNRKGGKGKDDIYAWNMNSFLQQAEKDNIQRFSINDKKSGAPIAAAKVMVIEMNNTTTNVFNSSVDVSVNKYNRNLLGLLADNAFYHSDAEGTFTHPVKEDKRYLVFVDKDGFMEHVETITPNQINTDVALTINLGKNLPAEQLQQEETIMATKTKVPTRPSVKETKKVVINQAPVKKKLSETKKLIVANSDSNADDYAKRYKAGSVFKLKNIYYDFNSADLRTQSREELDRIVDLLKEHPSMEITLSSHTDARGSASYNKILSQNRAQEAVNYIISRGISSTRLKAVGYGEEQPVNGCTDNNPCSRDAHQMNRRTEIKVDKVDDPDVLLVVKD